MTDTTLRKSFGTSSRTHRVFVYGTLKRGRSNHALLEASRFMDEAATLKLYWMITTGIFPILLDSAGEGFGPPLAVAGGIYRVDDATLEELDRLEREGRSYDRKATEVYEGDRKVDAHVYVGIADYWHPRRLPAWTIRNERGELDWAPS